MTIYITASHYVYLFIHLYIYFLIYSFTYLLIHSLIPFFIYVSGAYFGDSKNKGLKEFLASFLAPHNVLLTAYTNQRDDNGVGSFF